MAATTEPGAGSRQVQRLIWAMGEARLRRLDSGIEQGEEAVEAAAMDEPVDSAVVPGPESPDFFTEWQPPGP